MPKEYTFENFVKDIPCLKDQKNLGLGKKLKGHVITSNGMISLEKGYVTVMFYAEWCGHCHELGPKYIKAFEPVKLLTLMCRVDCTKPDCKKLAERFGIRGYPTVLRFKDGKLEKSYEGKREPFDLMCYALGLENDHGQYSAKYPDIEKNVNN